ncbi:tryptophan--tRNA ligase [Tumidithrix elongata RA019]|uniref:Tryptophan--tRNA ligase n=1 Tax=Tumidithrix elongata BACA0141 TaxID=2716417 RepID=A0AAW9PSG8_9CYAN|nr:tryptophan--tRNA ligase [Tumidithrix elongata RA019]
MQKKRVLSGVQPTGNLHIGNYLGAIRNWVESQAEYESYFCVVDLHAITAPHDPKALAENTRQVAAIYIACGIDPDISTIFIQSHLSAHAELTWLLNCNTPLNWLERMIQFKEKAIKQGENVNVGLLDYPVLMAADILLYQADLVPVGEDQKQHLELTRDIAASFNDRYQTPVFKIPAPLIRKEGARVMSLTDGTSKMSKSDPSELSRIHVLDDADAIAKKIKRCKTDAIRGLEFDNPERPECHNLLSLYAIVANKTKDTVIAECADMRGWGDFKPVLTEAVIEHLRPIRAKYAEVIQEVGYLDRVLKNGQQKAGEIAEQTLKSAKSALGFLLP